MTARQREPLMADARERFLKSIADHIAAERVTELHLFEPIRRGARETGVAVIAVEPEIETHSEANALVVEEMVAEETGDEAPSTWRAEDPDLSSRVVVYRANYRWTLKGPDRGRWELDVIAEADAPLDTVLDVVRGVQRRADQTGDPERLSGSEFRAALSETPWSATP